ncbi:hypothetical protein FH609_015120 [Streptomyces sp. 3MP-14]|uniref:Uncharacterized protein n=1 Tax=Streptomyces mimosae TaxID=2586635 RepID=A0A5N6ACS1_9ACTN|nr:MULTISPECIES: hypothetical protein [Streptomyces]KAB8165746.1 hypothetical protein FH607_012445 [Streptomyces mimosae]KAB8176135.1 hypothetical protein FH609_015120 [Streptomyces sp. 3MP-14]
MSSIDFPDDLSDLDGPEERRVQYIQGLLDVMGEDLRHVMLFVTVSLSFIVIVLTQLPFDRLVDLPLAVRLLLVVGLALTGAGALLFFRYVRVIHLARLGVARCLASADARHARQLWAGAEGVWETRGSFYRWGVRLTGLGGSVVALSVSCLLLGG